MIRYAFILCFVALPTPSRAADILLQGGTVIDGSGANRVVADVAISDGRISAIGPSLDVKADWTIDCANLIVCPGFIDLHNHSDAPIISPATRAAVNYVTQGCTTMVTGNCGSGPVDAAGFYAAIDQHGAGTNIAHLIPQGSLRRRVLGAGNVQPDPEQMMEMLQLAENAMQDGTWGMSTGLIYVPGSFASTAEITKIAAVVAKHQGIYASHIRGEGTGLLKSVDEALQIGKDAGLPVHISHFKSSGRDAWGLVREAARMINDARAEGHQVTADQYPYIASSTSLGATLLPSRVRAGGTEQLVSRLDDAKQGAEIRELLRKAIAGRDNGTAVHIARYTPNRAWVGRNLSAIAELEKKSAVDIAVDILRHGNARVVNFSMNEDDVRHIMAIDWVATASDGRAYLPSSDRPHPRNYGTFPRKLAKYALHEKVLSLEQAIRSMSGLPAEILSMKDRGLLKSGLVADITVFDPEQIQDNATFIDPHQFCTGIEYVFVNGTPALNRGKVTGALAGRAIRHVTPKAGK